MRKLPPYLSNFLLILLPIFLTACEQSAATAPASMPAAAVTVVTLTARPLTLSRELPGRVNPFLIAEVRPQVTGIVKEQLVNEGSKVEAGQELYQLDDAIYRADLNSAKASLARANAALEVARLTAERTASLVAKGTVSKQENDNATAMLRQAEAEVSVAAAAVASSEVMLGYARITAPISGRVGKSRVTRGALVTTNQDEPLLVVQQLDKVYVDVARSAAELLELQRQLAEGTLSSTADIPVRILLENDIEYGHEGKLLFSEVTVEPSTGSYLLRVEVPNPDNILLPGMYVRAVLSTGKREQALLVPQSGIARDPKGNATAMVVGVDGKAELRAVQVNRTIGDMWLIDSGLAAGEQVIVEGLQRVRPGAPVQITETRQLDDIQATAQSNAAPL